MIFGLIEDQSLHWYLRLNTLRKETQSVTKGISKAFWKNWNGLGKQIVKDVSEREESNKLDENYLCSYYN